MKINVDYLRPLKAEGMKKLYGQLRYKEELAVECFPDAVILPVKGEIWFSAYGGIVDREGNYVESSVCDGIFAGSYPYDCKAQRNEKVVYCGAFYIQWGHFLMDCIKRLWYFFENDTTIEKYIFTAPLNDKVSPEKNEIEFLKLLGVWEKIEIINCPTRFREVVLPERSHEYQRYYNDCHKKMFDIVISAAMEQNQKAPAHTEKVEKVFFSRSHFIDSQRLSSKKGESGQQLLDNFFEKNGYQILYPEELSLKDMICVLQTADECAMVEGTLPHNLMFARDGMKTIILEKRVNFNIYQVYVNEVKDLDVDYIDAYYVLYPAFPGEGPFYLDYTSQLEDYAGAYGLKPPDAKYLSEGYCQTGFESFMRTYKSKKERALTFDMAMLENPIYWEAYRESLTKFEDYLLGNKYWNTKGVYTRSRGLSKIRRSYQEILPNIKAAVRGKLNMDFYRKLSRCKYKILGVLHKLRYRDG